MAKNDISWTAQGRGTAIVFVHAFPLDSSMWEAQVAGLRDSARVITIDLPGFGGNPSDRFLNSIDDAADAITALLHSEGIDRAVIAGCSLGGYISLAVARRHPGLLHGLLLIDTRAGADAPEVRASRHATAAAVRERGLDPIIKMMVPKFFSPSSLARTPELPAIATAMMRRVVPEAAAFMSEAMAARPDSTPILTSITAPTCIIVGSDDVLTPPSEAAVMHRTIPGAGLVTLDGCGHLPSLEQPDALTSAIATFLSRIT